MLRLRCWRSIFMGHSTSNLLASQIGQNRLVKDHLAPGQFIQKPSVALPPMTAAAAHSTAAHSNRHEVNPALALKLLKDIEHSIVAWQRELRQVVLKMNALHAQGPMVDGWLESSLEPDMLAAQSKLGAEATLLRHGDADALMRYVEALEKHELARCETASHEVVSQEARLASAGSAEAQYRLCWLSDEGKVRSRACPARQMAVVSTAIARYQRYKQLLAHRQHLEAQLQSAVDGLTDVRSTARQSH